MTLYKHLHFLSLLFSLLHYSHTSPLTAPTNSLLVLPTLNQSHYNLPLQHNSNTSVGLPLTGYKWMSFITDGLWNIWEEYPDAVLNFVDSATDEYWPRGNPPSHDTRNPASFTWFRLTAKVTTDGPEDLLVTITGTLHPQTGQVDWRPLSTQSRPKNVVKTKPLDWLPEHDIFQAASVLDPRVSYWSASYFIPTHTGNYDGPNEYLFLGPPYQAWWLTPVVAKVDARTLEVTLQKINN